MFRWMRCSHTAKWRAASMTGLALAVLAAPEAFLSTAWGTPAPADESKVTNDIQSKLDKKQFKDVKVNVDGDGIATLTGSVPLYEYKVDADRRVHKVKGVKAVRNDIEVAGPAVSDQELQQKLQEKLQYDRVGYGNAFNAIGVRVQDGVATLSGHARTDVDKDSAMALVSTTPGVKEVVNNVEVDPVSIMDDQARLAVARAIYRDPVLSKYALNPAKPIRISVQNGNVELYGAVDSKMDRDLAYMRANSVPGIFSVKNYIQVAGQPSEQEKPGK